MLGETVIVLTRDGTTTDPLGDPVEAWSAEEVPNVIVKPTQGDDGGDADRVNGVRVTYTLAFPKSFSGNLAGARVVLSDRVGAVEDAEAAARDALRVANDPDRMRPCPTAWDMLAYVGRFDG